MALSTDDMIVEDHIIPQGVVLAVLAPFVFILDFPPLIWHLRNRNTAAVCLVSWIMLMNFISVINVIIWPYIDMRNMYDGQGLCDIEIKLLGARTTGLFAAVVCLLRALAAVLDTEKALIGPTKAQERRNRGVELALCCGLPLFTMLLQYIVQFNRFALLGVSGCQPYISNDWVGTTLFWGPPFLTNIVALYYAIIVIIRLRKYRSSFNSILASSNTTRSRFFRLFAIASTLILGITPVQIFLIVTQRPDSNSHFSFSKIHDPKSWNTSLVMPSAVMYDRWINVVCGFLIFFFFGLGKDAKEMYRDWLIKVGLGSWFPWLTAGRQSSQCVVLSGNSSKLSSRPRTSWMGTESSSQASCLRASTSSLKPRFGNGDDQSETPSPVRPLGTFLRRFDPRRRLEQPGTKYELPTFQRGRQKSEEDDRGVLVSKEVKRESFVI